ncbi:hypothetical protein ABE49_32815, partial [Bacillus thuringiensis]|nr:hypothetical protein [Bacillus thuringiensis]
QIVIDSVVNVQYVMNNFKIRKQILLIYKLTFATKNTYFNKCFLLQKNHNNKPFNQYKHTIM